MITCTKKTNAGRTKYIICDREDSQSHQAKEEQMERGPQIFLCIVGCTPPLSEEAEEHLKMEEKRRYIYMYHIYLIQTKERE